MGKKTQSMIPVKSILSLPEPVLEFLEKFIGKIEYFRFEADIFSVHDPLPLQNLDLWIEAYIDIFPELQDFRNELRTKMNHLGADLHPDWVYEKESNHMYYSSAKKIESLRELVKELKNKQ